MFKFEIFSGNLKISSIDNLLIVYSLDQIGFDPISLNSENENVFLYNAIIGFTSVIFNQPLSFCTNSEDVLFTKETFIAFCEENFGTFGGMDKQANETIKPDIRTISTRPFDFNLMVAQNLFEKKSVIIKDAFNSGISAASVPQDLWDNNGLYTGFPVGVIQPGMAVSNNVGDTGTLWFAYLSSPDDTFYSFSSVTLNGTTPVPLGVNIYRCNYAFYIRNSATAFNLGKISIYHQTTTSNIFVTIPIGYSQSYCGAYTVPKGCEIFLDRLTASLKGGNAGTIDCQFYYREFGQSPRLRFPFEMQFGSLYFDDYDYLIKIPEQTDIIPRVIAATENNMIAKVTYGFLENKMD